MKPLRTKQPRIAKLNLAKETIRSLKPECLPEIRGGLMNAHTSFSCGNDLCTTH